MIFDPEEIERRSMEIISSELDVELDEEIAPIVMRVIHATADLSFAHSLHFKPGVIGRMRRMMCGGASVITDTNMALAGINKSAAGRLGLRLSCSMADGEVAAEAKRRGCTRAAVCAERALRENGDVIFVCGNAPTALLRITELAGGTACERLTVIGVPVGYVNVVEAKQLLWDSDIPSIVSLGRRGGSGVAAAIVNALMYGIEGVRR